MTVKHILWVEVVNSIADVMCPISPLNNYWAKHLLAGLSACLVQEIITSHCLAWISSSSNNNNSTENRCYKGRGTLLTTVYTWTAASFQIVKAPVHFNQWMRACLRKLTGGRNKSQAFVPTLNLGSSTTKMARKSASSMKAGLTMHKEDFLWGKVPQCRMICRP